MLESTQFPIEQMMSLVSEGVKWPGYEAYFSYLVPAIRMYWAVPSFPDMLSWLARGQLKVCSFRHI
jgi:hypothetical protein